jgi:hypothetical protein
MNDLYYRLVDATRSIAMAVTQSAFPGREFEERIARTAIELPDLIISDLRTQMALTISEWAPNTTCDPLSDKILINGISIKVGK